MSHIINTLVRYVHADMVVILLPVCRSSLPPSMDAMQHTVELVYVQPTTTRRPEAMAQRFRVSSWHVPSTTKGAATKAVGRLATNPKFTTAGKEQEYDELVQSLHSSGRIGNARHTPAMRQRTVQDLPTLQVSAKLAHAAEIGMHQASHGYQLTAGIKPKTKFTQEHLSMLKRIQAGSNDSWK